MNNRLQRAVFPTHTSSRVISILSGKGGVGKSVIAMALAEQFTALGKRVLLVDADFGCGNLHILCNLPVKAGVREYITDSAKLETVTTEIRTGWHLLADNCSTNAEEFRSISKSAELIARLNSEAGAFERIIIDHGSGINDAATTIASGSDLSLVMIVPELTSISDGFGLCKYLTSQNKSLALQAVLNRCLDKAEADDLTVKFESICGQLLKRAIPVVGWIPEDPVIRSSVARQRPPAETNLQAPAVQALSGLAQALVSYPVKPQFNSTQTINDAARAADIRG